MKKNKGCASNAYPINSVINRYETRISKHKSFNILQQGGPAMPRKGAKGGGNQSGRFFAGAVLIWIGLYFIMEIKHGTIRTFT